MTPREQGRHEILRRVAAAPWVHISLADPEHARRCWFCRMPVYFPNDYCEHAAACVYGAAVAALQEASA